MIEYLIIAFISMLPWIELRLAIPLGIIVYGLDPAGVALVAICANILVFPPLHFILTHFYEKFKNVWIVKRTILKIRKSSGPKVMRYGFFGLITFVAIPLPVTGAWTGTLIAWLIGMDKKEAFIAISSGIIIAGLLVTIISVFAAELLDNLGIIIRP